MLYEGCQQQYTNIICLHYFEVAALDAATLKARYYTYTIYITTPVMQQHIHFWPTAIPSSEMRILHHVSEIALLFLLCI